MTGRREISDVEISAFIDGELDEVRREAVEELIRSDREIARRAQAFRADKDMLKRLYARPDERALPPKWLAMVHAAKPARPVRWRLAGAIAAALVVGVIGTIAIQSLRPVATGEIVEAALEARAAGDGTTAISGAPGRFDSKLSATIALPVKVPDMSKLGYHLVGIRLYPHSGGSGAAELLYRNGQDQLFTLYLRRSDGKTRFDQFERDGLRVCVWQDEVLGTVMAGDVSTAAMQRLASLAYTGLTL